MTAFVEELFGLSGKTAVVTGACGFLGRTFVRGLLQAEAKIIMLSRSDAIGEFHRQYAKKFGASKISSRQVDFYNREELNGVLQSIVANEKVDVLINNAYDIGSGTGFNVPEGRLESTSFEQWQRAFESGIYWAVRSTQVLGEQMKQQGKGSIINVASMYGIVSPNPRLYEETTFLNPPSYSVVKSGLIAFTRYVAAFWGCYNVRCNALAPGPFSKTQDESDNSVSENDPFLKRLEERTLLNRIGQPEELLGAILFLASDASSYVTGQVLVADGGWTIT